MTRKCSSDLKTKSSQSERGGQQIRVDWSSGRSEMVRTARACPDNKKGAESARSYLFVDKAGAKLARVRRLEGFQETR